MTPQPTPKRLGNLLPGQTVVEADEGMVRRLLRQQYPQWADLPLEFIGGWDNTNYRLGDDLLVRLPWGDWAVSQRDIEHRWVPYLAPKLPLDLPQPLALGVPNEEYPWPWSVFRWLEGEQLDVEQLADPRREAQRLADFIRALQRIDPTDAPLPTPARGRGGPLSWRDGPDIPEAIRGLSDYVDSGVVLQVWHDALGVPIWDLPPVWMHADLAPSNMLMRDGELSAVIDWHPLAGDPAIDLWPAWMVFQGGARDAFREAMDVDDATWSRGRGWALIYSIPRLHEITSEDPDVAARAAGALLRLNALAADYAGA